MIIFKSVIKENGYIFLYFICKILKHFFKYQIILITKKKKIFYFYSRLFESFCAFTMIKMTGTTICGLIYEDGVILGSDTRATMEDASGGRTLIDPDCSKINKLSSHIYCCGAGSAADMKRLSRLVEISLDNLSREPPVICPVTMLKRAMYKFQRHVTCAFIIGGVDATGPHLFTVFQGSSHSHKFCAKGSGLQPTTGILEAGWKENLSEQDAIDLMVDAVTAGILYDLGSGSKVDVTIIRTDGEVIEHKPYKVVGERGPKHVPNEIPVGTTKVLSTRVYPVDRNYWKRQRSGDHGDEHETQPKRLK